MVQCDGRYRIQNVGFWMNDFVGALFSSQNLISCCRLSLLFLKYTEDILKYTLETADLRNTEIICNTNTLHNDHWTLANNRKQIELYISSYNMTYNPQTSISIINAIYLYLTRSIIPHLHAFFTFLSLFRPLKEKRIGWAWMFLTALDMHCVVTLLLSKRSNS